MADCRERRPRLSGLKVGPVKEHAGRFWSHVSRDAECWIWLGATSRGYGSFWVHGTRTIRAHRVAWMLEHGAIPAGLFVCHRCDNQLCVRPDHLWLGTTSDNQRDSVKKGRHGTQRQPMETTLAKLHGEKHWNAKLTTDQAAEILRRHRDGEPTRDLARAFRLHPSSIRRIVAGDRWRRPLAARGGA